MNDANEFWALMDLVDTGHLDVGNIDDALEPLLRHLSVKSVDEINTFCEQLATALYAIDGLKWMEEAGESEGSADGFLYARCFVVAKGRGFYQQVLQNPQKMPKSCELWAEELLYVAGQAWAVVTGGYDTDYPRESSVSFETFSNTAQW